MGKNKSELPLTLNEDGRPPFRRQHTDEDKARWHAQYVALLEDSAPQEECDRIAADLHARAGKQMSRKYRMVATLPAEVNTKLAPCPRTVDLMNYIGRLDPKRAEQLWNKFFQWAAADYRTYLAEKDGNMHTLDLRTFEAFKRIERERYEAAQVERTRAWEAKRAAEPPKMQRTITIRSAGPDAVIEEIVEGPVRKPYEPPTVRDVVFPDGVEWTERPAHYEIDIPAQGQYPEAFDPRKSIKGSGLACTCLDRFHPGFSEHELTCPLR